MRNLDTTQPFILTHENVLSQNECKELIQRIEKLGPTIATINTIHGMVVKENVRNNERVIFDDVELAEKLYKQALSSIPEQIHGRTRYSANERLRCYRYQEGMKFAFHSDGPYIRNDQEQSYYTFLVYLNQGFEGGETSFMVEPEVIIKPKTGMGLLFQHPITHAGEKVTSGCKYVVRTDIMYRKKKA